MTTLQVREMQKVGPPGTGKTTSLARDVKNAAEKYGYDRVLVVAFTRASAAEIAGRDLPIPRHMVGTLHSMGYRCIGATPIAETKEGLRSWNAWVVSKEAEFGLSGEEQAPTGDDGPDAGAEPEWNIFLKTRGDHAYNDMMMMRAQMIDFGRPLDERRSWKVETRAFARMWEAWKREQGYIDFTDMIELPLRDKLPPPGSPSVIIGDEVQDFTRLEQALVRWWGSHAETLVMAGDPDQAIYGFKGGDPRVFLDHPVPPDFHRVLEQSFRVPRAIHTWAEDWIGQVEDREQRAYYPRDFEGSVQSLSREYAHFREPERLLSLVDHTLADGKTVMFLASCSYMLTPLIETLRAEGIPFENQWRRKRGDWNPLHGNGRGVSARERVLAFLKPQEAVWGERATIWTGDDVRMWAEALEAKGVLRHGAKAKLKELPVRELTPDELLRIFEEPALLGPILDMDLDWFETHLMESRRRVMEYPLAIAQTRGGATLRKKPQVTVGTIHSVKGGEADEVVLFPDLSPAGAEEYHDSQAGAASITRLFYVGGTRARESLILCGPVNYNWAVQW